MRAGMRLGIGLQAGKLLWRVLSFVCGMCMVPALGLALIGHYIEASVLVCVALALPRGLWWLVTRRPRAV